MNSSETVLITGHRSGLGRGLAEATLRRGSDVLGVSRGTTGIAGLREIGADLTDFDGVPKVIDTLLDGRRNVDLLVLNAGQLGRIEPIAQASIASQQAVFDVNVWAAKAVLDALLLREVAVGQVIAISSGAAALASRGWNAYAMSKATLNMLMRLYAQECPDTHFTALAPGLIDTPMLTYLLNDVDIDAFPTIGQLRTAAAAGRVQTPQAAAEAILDARSWLRESSVSGAFVDLRERIDPEAYAAIQARVDADPRN